MTTTQEKMLPLHEAAKKGYIHCAELLLEKQAVDMNEKNGQGLTPLHLAAMGGHLELVRLLVENGVDIDALTEPQRKTVEEVAKTPEIVAYLHAVRTSQVSVAFDFQDFQNPSFNLLPDALHSGFLWKSSGREKNKAKGWQRRWFVLLPSFVITYFKSPKDKQALKSIKIENIQQIDKADDVTKKPHSIQILTQQRTYYMYASCEIDITNWVQIISEQMRSFSLQRKTSHAKDSFLPSDPHQQPQLQKQSESGTGEGLLSTSNDLPSLGSLSLPQNTISGFLFKSGGRKLGNWQKRWIVLESDCINYFQKATDKQPCGTISYGEVIAVHVNTDSITKKSQSFGIQLPHRTFYFYATSESQRDNWIRSIEGVLSYRSPRSISPTPSSSSSSSSFAGSKRSSLLTNPISFDNNSSNNSGSSSSSTSSSPGQSPSQSSSSFPVFESPQHSGSFSEVPLVVTDSSSSTSTQDHNDQTFVTIEKDPSLETPDVPEPQFKEGFLWKTPGYMKKPGKWQRRWFVLQDSALLYFKNQKDKQPAGTIVLAAVKEIKADDGIHINGFKVATDDRTLYLYASSQSECQSWIQALTAQLPR